MIVHPHCPGDVVTRYLLCYLLFYAFWRIPSVFFCFSGLGSPQCCGSGSGRFWAFWPGRIWIRNNCTGSGCRYESGFGLCDKKIRVIFANFSSFRFFFDCYTTYFLRKSLKFLKSLSAVSLRLFEICHLFIWPGLKGGIRIQKDLKTVGSASELVARTRSLQCARYMFCLCLFLILYFLWGSTSCFYCCWDSKGTLSHSWAEALLPEQILPQGKYFFQSHLTHNLLFILGCFSRRFWASWILLSSSKNTKKNLDSCCFSTSLWLFSLKNFVNIPSKSNMQKNFFKLVFCGCLEGRGRK